MVYNLLVNEVNWGYNPFTNHLLTSWDIQVLGIRCICTCDGENQLLEAEIFAFDASSAYFQGPTCCFVSGEGM